MGWIGDGRLCVLNSGSDDLKKANTDYGVSVDGVADCTINNICHPQARCSEISNTVVCSCLEGLIGSGIGPNGCIRGTALNCATQPCKVQLIYYRYIIKIIFK